jgi:methionyl-tRNA formyltransferase
MTPLRIVFMGTPPLAATVLEALLAQKEFKVSAVVTQPDQPRGRDLKLQPSAVKELALARGLDVLQPQRARDPQFIEQARALAPDLTVVAAYGQILPQALLDVPKLGSLNVHTSLLPRYRGAAPIQWAILNGDRETGVTIMKMDAGLDTGDIVSEQRTPVRDDDTAATLHDRLAEMGGRLLVHTIPDYIAGKIIPRPQPQEGMSYARKITREDGRLDWSQPARALWNRVRGLTPWPGTYSFLQREPAPVLLKIIRAQPEEEISGHGPGEIISVSRDGIVVGGGAGALRILELQREGGKRMAVQQFMAGFSLHRGERFVHGA